MARSDAIFTSHTCTNSHAPPSAYPLTAAMTGLLRFHTIRNVSMLCFSRERRPSTDSGSPDGPLASLSMSNPAENARPAPVRITTRTSGSASMASIASRNSDISVGLRAFSFSGRFRVR